MDFSLECRCIYITPLVSSATELPNNTPSLPGEVKDQRDRDSERYLGDARGYCSAAEVGISSTLCYIGSYLISLIYGIIIYHMQISPNRLKLTFQLRDETWREEIRKNYFTSFCT